MKVMVIVRSTPSSEAGELPSTELLAEMGKYNEQLVDAGIMLAGEGLKPSSEGARVQFSGSRRTVFDGPFTETKELIAGFWIWRVGSMQEAIDWVKKCPNPMKEDSEIEIRPVFEADDLGEMFTPELREQEAAIRAVALGMEKPTFQDAPAMVIAGINATYTADSRMDIPHQWQRFAQYLGRVPGQVGVESYGVCWNTKPNCGFDYLTGVAVSDIKDLPSDFTTLRLDARRHAIFTHAGHVSKLPQTIDQIWSQWVPDCGLKIADAPCFERYTSQFNPTLGEGGMELWIPLD